LITTGLKFYLRLPVLKSGVLHPLPLKGISSPKFENHKVFSNEDLDF